MTSATDLITAFDAALRQVDRALAANMRTLGGEPARLQLEQLRADLHARRQAAADTGRVDPDWVRDTVRSIVAWAPATEMALIAALGQIARANGRERSV